MTDRPAGRRHGGRLAETRRERAHVGTEVLYRPDRLVAAEEDRSGDPL